MDQSLFAAPHSLSQRSTSFIASHCQGIHRIPLRHLIALIINIHTLGRVCCMLLGVTNELETPNPHAKHLSKTHFMQLDMIKKDQFAS
jgi:hypothetical protein